MDIIEYSRKIVQDNFGHEVHKFVRISEGSVSEVYWFELNSRKYVLKYLKSDQLTNELFFYQKTEPLGVCVPKRYGSGKASDSQSFYVMNYIEGHNDPDTDTVAFFSEMVRQVKLMHSIRFKGFGKFTSESLDQQPIFEINNFQTWIHREIQRLTIEFELLKSETVVLSLNHIDRIYESCVPTTTVSCLVHGDLGFGNVRFLNDQVYFIDPGWNRAMTPLWEVAYFDYKYIRHPTKAYRSILFRSLYFPDGISQEEENEMAIYRLLCAIETYRWYLKKGMDEAETRGRFERNAGIFEERFGY